MGENPMPTPDRSSFSVQAATLQSLLIASRRVTESYLRLVSKQQRTLGKASTKRRADDGGRRTLCWFSGADLQDHYGRRSHDIDVERL